MFGILGVFAEFERSIIQERVKGGLARARAHGKKLGRPKADTSVEERIRQLAAQGMGKVKIAKILGVGVSVTQRGRHRTGIRRRSEEDAESALNAAAGREELHT
jgi:DNA invertase Pin-like site-specific DNA recombinase